jgi:hypothetical protein
MSNFKIFTFYCCLILCFEFDLSPPKQELSLGLELILGWEVNQNEFVVNPNVILECLTVSFI